MGHSITCTYHCEVSLSDGKKLCYGAMSLREAYGTGKSHALAYGAQLVKINVFGQTVAGRAVMQKDYLIIDAWGNKDHYFIDQAVPFYTF
jgi:hypothetical protein